MYLPCEAVARYILPFFRSCVAKELVEKYNFTQMGAAEKLGTTQAAISQYLHSKRGHKGIEQFEATLPMVQSVADETAKRIASGKIDEEVMVSFCKLCVSLREGMRPG
jgi:predicted transcriptional regulator